MAPADDSAAGYPAAKLGAAESAAPADALYRRTLRFAVSVAAQLVGKHAHGGQTAGEGFYFEADGGMSAEEVKKLGAKVEELVKAGAPIESVTKPFKEVLEYMEKNGQTCAKAFLVGRVTGEVACHECSGVLRVALHPLHASMSALQAGDYGLLPAAPGFVASYAAGTYQDQPILLGSHRDHLTFARSHGVTSVGDLNAMQEVGRTRKDYILASEFRQESKLGQIAQKVKARAAEGKMVKVICIAGPTSSGKTTFANKLCMYLVNEGFVAKPLTVDHYYLPLDRQPKYQANNQRSDVDYDHIESMDVQLVGEHLAALARGESVMTPVYNMKTGFRDGAGHKIDALPENGILVIEGIHALNPLYTETVDADKVFKVFISPLSVMQMDDCNSVKTTDHRLLRRMCRDYMFRGNSASTTLAMWDNVRAGEGTWIFPHQNAVDFMMNSCADYEIPVLKTFIEPLLRAVTPDDKNYAKAVEMLKFLDHFSGWPPGFVPSTALLREFIGEGAFDCH